MRKLFITICLGLFISTFSFSQNDKEIYNPNADAKKEITNAIAKAKAENKHVLIQVGGNWCSWCIKFHKFVKSEPTIDSLIKANYVYVLLNYSKENKNLDLLKEYKFPQRFGFPVLLVLNGNGELLHTQDSGFLESGKGYDEQKVYLFLKNWRREAFDPEQYSK